MFSLNISNEIYGNPWEPTGTHENPPCIRVMVLVIVIEFVTGGVELLRAVLHGYAGGLIFMK